MKTLSHSNQWMRATAQRILVERNDPFAKGFLQSEFKKAPALGRLHILWTLHALGGLTEELLVEALSGEANLREQAIVLIRAWGKDSTLLAREVFKSLDDDDARVRFQAVLSVGETGNPAFNAKLAQVYLRDQNFPFTRLAVLSSIRSGAVEVLQSITPTNEDAVRELADLVGAEAARKPDTLAEVVKTASPTVLEGLAAGLARKGARASAEGKLAVALAGNLSPAAIRLARTVQLPRSAAQLKALVRAGEILKDRSRPLQERINAARVLEFEIGPQALFAGISGSEPHDLQEAVFQSLRAFNDAKIAKFFLEHWREISPALRIPILNHILQRPNYYDELLAAMETGRVPIGELNLDLEQRRRLMRRGTEETRARAAKLMGDEEYSNRKRTVEEMLAKLPTSGDATAGAAAYEKVCAQCHKAGGRGFEVGPDLTSVSHRSVEDLLSNILDPNMAINPAYLAFEAELENGDLETGVLAAQTAEAVTLMQAGGRRVTLERGKLKKFQSANVSLMPEGLEAGLTAADLRNLIAFLQEGAK